MKKLIFALAFLIVSAANAAWTGTRPLTFICGVEGSDLPAASTTAFGTIAVCSDTDKAYINIDNVWVEISGGGGAASNSFETINASSGTDPVADSSTDTLNVTAGTGIAVTGDSTTDTITIAATAPSIILDLGDDGGNDSTALAEIATKNDDYLALEEESADKAMLDFRQVPPYDNYDPMRPPADCSGGNGGFCDEFYDNTASQTYSCNGGGGAQSIVNDGYLMIPTEDNASAQNQWACTTAAPTESWTATALVTPMIPRQYARCGLVAIRSGTQATPTALTNAIFYSADMNGENTNTVLQVATSYTTGEANAVTGDSHRLNLGYAEPVWLQLRYDDTANTLAYYISFDGYIFLPAWVTTDSTIVAPQTGVSTDPPYVGMMADHAVSNAGASGKTNCFFHFFRVRTDANRNEASD